MLPWSGSIWWVGRSVSCDKGEKKIEREREREREKENGENTTSKSQQRLMMDQSID
jgi:hypothetical protein